MLVFLIQTRRGQFEFTIKMSIQFSSSGLLSRIRPLNQAMDDILVSGSRFIDLAYSRLVNAPMTTPFFENGWGDLDIVDFERDGWALTEAKVGAKPLENVCVEGNNEREATTPRNEYLCSYTNTCICI